MNKDKKNSKLRVIFWLVSLPKGRYRRQAPFADVSESLGLRGEEHWIKWFIYEFDLWPLLIIFCLKAVFAVLLKS